MVLLGIVVSTTGACTGSGEAADTEVLVFAAASLTDAFGEIEVAFEAAHPDVDVRLNLAGSSSLREQILEGAPADVFASANRAVMDEVAGGVDIVGSPVVFATNRLQIVVPAGNPAGVSGLASFSEEGLLLGLCARGVPCGDLAHAALDRAGIVASVDTEEPDVRALLAKVAEGELDAGIVYVSDVVAAGVRVEGIDIEPALVSPDETSTEYPIVVLADAPHPTMAAALVDYVLAPEGQLIMARHGFSGS